MDKPKKANPFAAKSGKPSGKMPPAFKKGVPPTFPPAAKKAKKGK